MKIGTFSRNMFGVLQGKIFGLGLNPTDVAFKSHVSAAGNEYLRIVVDPYIEAYEVGVAFEKQKGEMTYYSVSLNSPAFPFPVNAALFPDKNMPGQFNLVWERSDPTLRAEANLENGKGRRFMGAQATL